MSLALSRAILYWSSQSSGFSLRMDRKNSLLWMSGTPLLILHSKLTFKQSFCLYLWIQVNQSSSMCLLFSILSLTLTLLSEWNYVKTNIVGNVFFIPKRIHKFLYVKTLWRVMKSWFCNLEISIPYKVLVYLFLGCWWVFNLISHIQ